ncbi:hypothetical protein ACFQ2B_32540 [Streptomyces stramineus]|uniref:Uncharacterized protein n=1 Tax=Streptomyces stramineus TaxID=173861 RepID=A0ABN1B4H1_9ACTN
MRQGELSTLLGESKDARRELRDAIHATAEELRRSIGESRTEVLSALRAELGAMGADNGETRARAVRAGDDIADLRQHVQQLHLLVRGLAEEVARTREALTAVPPGAVAGQEHRGAGDEEDPEQRRELLRAAARVASATLVCHRDTWEFLMSRVAGHAHFRMPHEVADYSAGRVQAALSGRSLIAVLIALGETRDRGRDGDWALATTVYDRLAEGLGGLSAQGLPLSIVLDDRAGDVPEEPGTA